MKNRLICTLLISAGLVSHAVGEERSRDPDYWYLTGSAGVLFSPKLGGTDLVLSKTQQAITIPGEFAIAGKQAFGFTLGRHFERDYDAATERKHPTRIELEYWGGDIQRDGFKAGVLDLPLDDTIEARAIFLNGAVQLWSGDSSSFWLGAGIGDSSVKMPRVADSSCECLYAAEGRGIAYRLKLNYEHAIGDSSAWFVDLGHVWLPAAETSRAQPAYSGHGKLKTAELRLGLRIAF